MHSSATAGYTILVDEFGRLAIRLTNYNSGGTLASARVQTVSKPIQENKWVHFAVQVKKAVASGAALKSAGNVNIYIDGRKVEVQVPSDVGSPDAISSKTAGSSYAIGYGPAQDETQPQIQLNGKLADLFLLQPEGDLTQAEIEALYSAASNGARHLGSGFLHTTPYHVKTDALARQTHPTVARSSNDGRLGTHKIHFDDSRAIHLTNDGPTSFPTMLTEDDATFALIYSSFGKWAANINSGICFVRYPRRILRRKQFANLHSFCGI